MKLKPIEFPACGTCENRCQSVFYKLNQDELNDLSNCKGCNQYLKGNFLFYEGARPTGVHCIHSGIVKIYKQTSDGKYQIIKLAGAGDIVGYEALFSNGFYKTFAQVIEETLVCYIPKNQFMLLLKDNYAFMATLMHQLSLDVIESENRIISIATKPVRERVAESLLQLQEFFGKKNKSKNPIEITISREELAAFNGTATETVIRILSEFRQGRMIDLGKRSIHIINHKKLTGIAFQYNN